jgi:hypothetical protein
MSVARQIGLLLALPMLILAVLALSVGIMVVGAAAYLFLPAVAMPLAWAVTAGQRGVTPATPDVAIAVRPVVALLPTPIGDTRPDMHPEKRAA